MPETKKPEIKREEYRRYLDQAGVLDELTKFLVTLYEEPDKPTDAVTYMKKILCAGAPDAADVENMRAEIESLKTQVDELKTRSETAEAELASLKQPEGETTEAPTEPKAEE